MAEADGTECPQSTGDKGRKDRACPRTRRRRRKSAPLIQDGAAAGNVSTTELLKEPRWVKVSNSKMPGGTSAARSHSQRPKGSFPRNMNRASDEHGRSFSPWLPSEHLLSVTLPSPATLSGTQGERQPAVCHEEKRVPRSIDKRCDSEVGTRRNGKLPSRGRFPVTSGWVVSRGCEIGYSALAAQVEGISSNLSSTSSHDEAAIALGGDGGVQGSTIAQTTWREGGDVESSPRLCTTAVPTILFWHDLPEPAGFPYTMKETYVLDDDPMWNGVPAHNGEELELLSDEGEREIVERRRWQEWAKHAAEQERQRRVKILENMDREERRERLARRAWALSAMDEEQRRRAGQQFLLSIEGTNWFQGTISSVDLDYEIVCPYSSLGCSHICLRTELEDHLAKGCRFNREPEDSDSFTQVDASEYEVVCPNTILGCDHSCSRSSLNEHLERCRFTGPDRTEEKAERERSLQMVLQQAEEERARRVADDAKGDWQSDSLALKTRQFLHRLLEDQMRTALVILHKEILDFAARCRLVQEKRKHALEDIWLRTENVIGLLWPASSVLPYGSWASGMMTPDSDVDLVVCLGRRGSACSPKTSSRAVVQPVAHTGKTSAHDYYSDQDRLSTCAPDVARDPRIRTEERRSLSAEWQHQSEGSDTPAARRARPEPDTRLDVRRNPSSDLSPLAVGFDADHVSASLPDCTWRKTAEDAGPKEDVLSATISRPTSDGGNRSQSSRSGGSSWERRRGWGRSDGASMLSRIQDLADHLRQHAPFIEVVKVVDHTRVPIIKAIAVSDSGGEPVDSRFTFNVDISIDGPAHSGLATSAFVSYLADHLPNLIPLTMVLKSLLQNHGMNDPFRGGLSSYGLVLMVTFALLRQDHLQPSPAGPLVVDGDSSQRSKTDACSHGPADIRPSGQVTEDAHEQVDAARPTVSSPAPRSPLEKRAVEDAYSIPPSPGQVEGYSLSSRPNSQPRAALLRKRVSATVGKQRGFWQPSSHGDDSSSCGTCTSSVRPRSRLDETPTAAGRRDSTPHWDRSRQQHWIGSRTARAILMQDFYAGAPTPCPAVLENDRPSSTADPSMEPMLSAPHTSPRLEDSASVATHHVPPPPPPPLPQPLRMDSLCPVVAPRSPYITSGGDPVLGELLLDFLHLFGEDFDMAREGFSVRGGGFRFNCHDSPPHPQAGDPIVIEDPLNCMNNVGRSSFAIGQVQRVFCDALTTLKATMVRVNQDGKEVLEKVSGSSGPRANTGILRHICNPPGGCEPEVDSRCELRT